MKFRFDETNQGLVMRTSQRVAMHGFRIGLVGAVFASMMLSGQSAFAQHYGVFSNVDRVEPSAHTIPFWTSSFTYNGVTYPYRMVGTDPATSNSTTVIPTTIVPVKFVFADGNSLDATSKVDSVRNSPIFQGYDYGTGFTQYGDAIQRAEFWSSVSTTSPNWHTLLASPSVTPTLVIDVPKEHGFHYLGGASYPTMWLVDFDWFWTRMHNTLSQLHIQPTSLPIFLTNNVYLLARDQATVYFGYHGSGTTSQPIKGYGNQVIQTYIYSAWSDDNSWAPVYVDPRDIGGLSHEIAEWYNDPFGNNWVPRWQNPTFPQAQQGDLEVADVLEYLDPCSVEVTIGGRAYHPANVALLPWFAREYPSRAYQGAYSFPDTTLLPTFSQPPQ
jgi:hypothetical protein